MIRRPPRSTLSSSSAASDVYKRQRLQQTVWREQREEEMVSCWMIVHAYTTSKLRHIAATFFNQNNTHFKVLNCLHFSYLCSPWYAACRWGRRDRLILHLTPVSYTHLRAHETPEHLVCRLLLEKKKKTNDHNINKDIYKPH
eukprot:TRINITY_DN65021_c0_g1_i1.p1 TRINITY_DN65021_c0_g1~~TRINITY_DN65021_c0_g1_i1.p1  ORF type:complete len:142 (-),score=14.62 TRINITY_DN65021_c0_g1_i1:73-498(-)